MPNEQLQQQMQKAIDGELDPELAQKLFEIISQDPEASSQYECLQSLDLFLKTAPYARAPERLAIMIMARLAEAVQTRAETEKLPEATRQALMLSLSLVTMLMLPTMLAASWMVLYLKANPQILSYAIYQVIALLVMVIDALIIMLDQAESLAQEHPQIASFMITLIPRILLETLESIEDCFCAHSVNAPG